MGSTRPKFLFKKICTRCGNIYTPTGKYSKFCEPCKKILRKESIERNKQK